MKKYSVLVMCAFIGNFMAAQGVTKNGSVVTDTTLSALKVVTVAYPKKDGTANQV
jgi:hypothetical protein